MKAYTYISPGKFELIDKPQKTIVNSTKKATCKRTVGKIDANKKGEIRVVDVATIKRFGNSTGAFRWNSCGERVIFGKKVYLWGCFY